MNNLFVAQRVVVGDVEKITLVIEQHLLALGHAEIFAQHDDAVIAIARGWSIREMRYVFRLECDVLVALLTHDLFFDPWLFLSLPERLLCFALELSILLA